MTALAGARVVVTRSSEDADSLGRALEALGAEVIRLPTIAIEFPETLMAGNESVVDDLREARFDWIVFSSSAGVRALTTLLTRRGAALGEVLRNVRVAAVGSATVTAFEQAAGRTVDLVPEEFSGSGLAARLGAGQGRVLLLRPEEAPKSIVAELRAKGWQPVEVPLYRTVKGEPDPDAVRSVREGDFDVLTFTSGSTARFFVELVGEPSAIGVHEQGARCVVVIGPSTEAVARNLGFGVDAVADPHTTEGVVSAVVGVVGR